MATNASESGALNALLESDIETKFARLRDAIPSLDQYKHSPILPILLDEAECRDLILPIMVRGITDVWLPLSPDNIPDFLDPGHHFRFTRQQKRFLSDGIVVPQGSSRGQHFNLGENHLATNYRNRTKLPQGLQLVRPLGDGGFGFVEEVHDVSSKSNFALKRIERKTNFKELVEQMRYVMMELIVLKKIRNHSPHYVSLVCGYTDLRYVGILMEPVADRNLGDFLDGFSNTDKRGESILAGFFGCLATALAMLHLKFNVRHKDIKPTNILVKGQNVLLTDFGTALDWSGTGHTTTQQELQRSGKYAAPETSEGETRNSKADVWSLGCVFLEIAAVLKGMPRSEVEEILEKNGTGSVNYRQNEQGIKEIIERLKQRDARCGNAPLDWIERMLERDKQARPNTRQLRAMIFDSKKCGLPLWGGCCRDVHLFGEMDSSGGTSQSANGLELEDTWTRLSLESQLAKEVLPSHDDDTQASRELLGNHFDIKGPKSWRGLLWAAETGKVNAVRLLLRHGADISIITEEGTVAHMAAAGGHVDVLQLLKDNNSKVDERYGGANGWTPLHNAVKKSHESAVKFLLKNGADPRTKVEKGWTALHSAAENRSGTIAKLLLDSGAGVSETNDDMITPLHKSAFSGSVSVAELLLQRGADVNERDCNVSTALHAAARTKVAGVAKILLHNGADVDTTDEDGHTPLHWAAGTGNIEVVRLLLDHGADIDRTTEKLKCTPLWLAARNNRSDVVQLLVKRKAKVDKANHHGFTPLLLTASGGDYEIVELLLARADVEQKAHDGKTALHMAATENKADVAKLLLDKGWANTESRDKDNWTALHWAAERGHGTIIQVLLDKGADPEAKDNEGFIPRHRAESRGHKQVQKLLEEHQRSRDEPLGSGQYLIPGRWIP